MEVAVEVEMTIWTEHAPLHHLHEIVLKTSVLASISGENLEVKSVLAHVFSAVPLWYTST
jgi:hypothetical protein